MCDFVLDETGGADAAVAEGSVELDHGGTGFGHGDGVLAGCNSTAANNGDRRGEERSKGLECDEGQGEEGSARQTADLRLVC